nr:sodium coupled monocarboxylate transporter 1 [Hymenolepis microstoma]
MFDLYLILFLFRAASIVKTNSDIKIRRFITFLRATIQHICDKIFLYIQHLQKEVTCSEDDCPGFWDLWANGNLANFQLQHGSEIRNRNTENLDKESSVGAEEIFLGNRKMGLLPIFCSTLASFLSAVALMGNNSEFYRFGTEFWCIVFGYCIAFPLSAEIYAPVFYKLHLVSGHEYLELRFSRLLRWLVTIAFCLQMVIYIAVVLYAPALAISRVTGLPESASILTAGMIGTLYTAVGGLKAVVWTDLLQTIVMIIGLVLIMVFGCQDVGGIERIWDLARKGQRLNTFDFNPDPFVRHSTWTLAIGGAGMVLSIYATNQTQIQRYLACKDLKTARRAIHLQLPINVVLLSVQLVIGLVTYAVFANCDPVLNGDITAYDQLFPHLIMHLFKNIPALRGLFLSTIFAAALSTLSSGVNGIACVLVEDVFMDIYLTYHKGSGLKQKTVTFIARFVAFIFGLLIIGLAFLLQVVPTGVLQMAFSIFGAIGGPILTVFTLGMICPFVNKWGGLAGFLTSLTVGLTLMVGSINLYTFKEPNPPPLSVSGCTNASIADTTTATSPPQDYPFSFFNLSYLYITLACLIVGFVFSTIVSFSTGMNTKTPVSQSLLAWQAVWLYSKLPSCIPSQSSTEVVESSHVRKITAMVRLGDNEVAEFDEKEDDKMAFDSDKNGEESVQELRL